MNMVFKKNPDIFIIVLIDDIVIYSQGEDQHVNYLRIILQVLKDC